MNTYIALFRGINVGGKNLLPMKDLVAVLDDMSYENIHTYIQSGNVVFQSKEKVGEDGAGEIGRRVLAKMDFEPKVLLLCAADLQAAAADNPFPTSNGKVLHFFFLESPTQQANTASLESLKAESEEFKLSKKVFYLYAPDGIGRSKLAARIEKVLAVPVTARNWNTVSQLISMVEKP